MPRSRPAGNRPWGRTPDREGQGDEPRGEQQYERQVERGGDREGHGEAREDEDERPRERRRCAPQPERAREERSGREDDREAEDQLEEEPDAVHRPRAPGCRRPQALIRRIPQTGRKTLYLAAHAGKVFGLSENEGKTLINDLITHATRAEFVYIHRYRVNDLVMWDDRCTMHRGTPFDDTRFPRDIQRATVRDIASTLDQEGLRAPA